MSSLFDKEKAQILIDRVLPRLTGNLVREGLSPDRAYAHALGEVVLALLRSEMPGSLNACTCACERQLSHQVHAPSPNSDCPHDWIVESLGRVAPGEVGKLYEHARGFRAEAYGDNGEIRISSCPVSKRNQGLFYTPESVVRYIVSKALDALVVKDPLDLLNIRILDPAVGTGIFLVEALNQLTERILDACRGNEFRMKKIQQLKENVQRYVDPNALKADLTERVALRIHLVRTCLHGVDLDPIAVAVCRAVLVAEAVEGLQQFCLVEPQILVGNSLIGDGERRRGSDSRTDSNSYHAAAYFCREDLDPETVEAWAYGKKVLHWPMSYPEVFSDRTSGFDLVTGNPPYEIVSVKESGIEERRREQAYFRKIYGTCSGKINTYRLMLERGLMLLREGGALGFIVPATLLADSSAKKIRRWLLDRSLVLQALVLPERARVFRGVTQACVILVARKGARTESLRVASWKGERDISLCREVEIPRTLLSETEFRIPILKSSEEKALLETLEVYPKLRGGASVNPAGRVHQGEINMTVHRKFLSAHPTEHVLVRGEHIEPFRVVHPSPGGNRWDWVVSDFLDGDGRPKTRGSRGSPSHGSRTRGGDYPPWHSERVVLGRVVNMGTKKRLKAALVGPGTFLGDMTNYLDDIALPRAYLLGVLNSRVLNWRLKLTSTNNYLSAEEVEALPIPRCTAAMEQSLDAREIAATLDGLIAGTSPASLRAAVLMLDSVLSHWEPPYREAVLVRWIERLAESLSGEARFLGGNGRVAATLVLDAAVVELYGASSLVGVLENDG